MPGMAMQEKLAPYLQIKLRLLQVYDVVKTATHWAMCGLSAVQFSAAI